MINIDIDYEKAIDFGHCEMLSEAASKLSELTNILNRILMIRQRAKKDILIACAKSVEQNMHKLSWDNKLVRLMEESSDNERLVMFWQEADTAYRMVKNKQSQVVEDIMALKKEMDNTPR